MGEVSSRSFALGRKVEKRVRGRCARGSCGRDGDDPLGLNSFSDAPSLPRAKSIQQSDSANKERKEEQESVREGHATRGVTVGTTEREP